MQSSMILLASKNMLKIEKAQKYNDSWHQQILLENEQLYSINDFSNRNPNFHFVALTRMVSDERNSYSPFLFCCLIV